MPETNGAADPGSAFYGREVVFTGTLNRLFRKDALDVVAAAGGIAKDSVTKTTNILVVGEEDPRTARAAHGASGKLLKALQWNAKGRDIEIIDEAEFLRRAGLT